MSELTWERVKKVFHEASALPSEERAALLDRVCDGDGRLRAEVEALLESHEEMQEAQPNTLTQGGAAAAEDAGSKVGRYKLLQKIGEGGFGTVYMAEQEEPVRRRVALKIIKLGMDTKQVIARFEAERQALALMDHPNIAKVLDAGATGTGRPYFVMELVRGVPITEYCDQNKLGTRARLDLFISVCSAVQHAHQKGVIHRDIKPSNVMVTLHDGMPVPKIIDFGIAKATNQRLTERTLFTEYNQFIGTPAYMSPEQAEMSGLDVDTRSDIYSLGVLLYELLTGTTPLDSRQLRKAAYSEIQRLIREEEPHRPSVRISTLGRSATVAAQQRSTDLPGLARVLRGDLDWVVMKALEKDRTRRYETANAMRRDLERYLGNEPVSASPPGSAYRLRKFVRRNRTAVGIGATVSVALVIGLLLAAAGFVEARREAEASKAINEFFTGMLASVDPRRLSQQSGLGAESATSVDAGGERTHDVSVAQMMLRARERIGPSFAAKPLLEATARETIGLSLLGLGRPRDGTAELELALDIRRRALGEEHPDTLRSRLQFGMGLTESGRAPEARTLLGDLRESMTRIYGEDDPRTLHASTLYAVALMQDREHGKSDPIFEETLARQREILGDDHRDTLITKLWWASSMLWRGRGADAEALSREVYESSLRTMNPNDAMLLWSRSMLGWALNFQGKRAEGEVHLRAAVDGISRIFGDEHPFTGNAKMGLGRSLTRAHGEEKLQLWRESLAALRASEGNASPALYVIYRDLAFLLMERGETEEGLELLQQAVDGFRAKYGEDHAWTIDNIGYLVRGLRKVGRIDEAFEVERESLEIRRRKADDPEASGIFLNSVAWALLHTWATELRDPQAALALAERARASVEPDRLDGVLDTLALALYTNGRTEEAIDVQREALDLLSENNERDRSLYLASLVSYLDHAARGDEASRTVLERVEALQRGTESATDFVGDIGYFSNRLSDRKAFERSEQARREALRIVEAEWSDDWTARAGLLYRIGRALLYRGEAEEAVAVLRQGLAFADRIEDEEILTRLQLNLAEGLNHLGRFAQARAVAGEILARRAAGSAEEPEGGFDEALTMEARRLAGVARLGLGEAGAAEPLLEEAAEWFVRKHSVGSLGRAKARSALGESLLAQSRYAEAETELLQSQSVLVEELGAQATATLDAQRRVDRLYEVWDSPRTARR